MAYAHNGIEYPSVTTILGLLDKPALVPWAARMVVEYLTEREEEIKEAALSGDKYALVDILEKAQDAHKKAKNEAASIGTLVHKAVETYTIMGVEPEFPETEEGEAAKEGFNAYLDWEEKNHVEYLHNELELVDTEIGYAGTTDAICRINGTLFLLDFKTSKGIYDEHKIQVSAYVQAWEKDPRNEYKEPISQGVLKLDKVTGIPEFLDVTAGHEQRVRAFNALTDFYYKQKKRRLKNNPIVKEIWGKK